MTRVASLLSAAWQACRYAPAGTRLSATSVLATVAPSATLGASRQCSTTSEEDLQHKKVVNRLIYRSKQRGFLELDLVVGQWAERRIPHMASDALADTSAFLDEENPDMWKWLTGQEPVPPRLVTNVALLELQKEVEGQMREVAPPATQAKPGVDWVRGWDDAGWKGKMPPAAERTK